MNAKQPAATLSIDRPTDFLALQGFAPNRVKAGAHDFSLRPLRVEFLAQGSAEADEADLKTSDFHCLASVVLDAAQKPAEGVGRLSWLLSLGAGSLPLAAPGKDARELLSALCSAIVQGGFNQLKTFLSLKGGEATSAQAPQLSSLKAPPELGSIGSHLIMDALLRGRGLSLPLRLRLPLPCLELLHSLAVPSSAARSVEAATLLLSLDAASPRSREPRQGPYTVAALLSELSPSDRVLVVQNCLIPAHGPKALPSLFRWVEIEASHPEGEAGKDQPRPRIRDIEGMDPSDLLDTMPPSYREDFLLALPFPTASSRDECLALNESALHVIASARASGKIMASPRLEWLLKERFLKEADAAAWAELEGMRAAALPSAALKGLRARMVQAVCAALDDKTLATALMDEAGQLEALRRMVSGARMSRLREEARYQGRRLESGELGPKTVIDAKRQVLDTVEKIKERFWDLELEENSGERKAKE